MSQESVIGSNVGDNTVRVAVAVVVTVVFTLLIVGIVTLIVGILMVKGRLKSIPYQRNVSPPPPQALVDIESKENIKESKQRSETSNAATVTTKDKQTGEHVVECESQELDKNKRRSIPTITTSINPEPQEPEHYEVIPMNSGQARKFCGIIPFDTLKWRLDLKEVSGRTFKEVKVKENCRLKDFMVGFKRGRVYYEFYHEIESVSEDQELIFLKVCFY